MKFDIINLTETELKALNAVQMRLLRTAQQKKDELYRKAEKDLKTFKKIVLTAGMKNSNLVAAKEAELQDELDFKTAYLADNLIYNMSLNEPGGETGGGGDEEAGYLVDYSLTYNERYVIVRDYYLAIEDPVERMELYKADDVAKEYLASYYSTLFNVLYAYSK